MTLRLLALGAAWTVSIGSTVAMALASVAAEGIEDQGQQVTAFTVALATMIATTTSVGWLLVARRPGNRVGLLLAAGGTILAWAFLGFGVGAARFDSHGRGDVVGGVAALIGHVSVIPALYLTFPAATVLFPDGRVPGPRWRWPFRATVVAIVVGAALAAASPWVSTAGLPDHPFPLPLSTAVADVAGGLSGATLIGSLGLALGAIVTRFRRSTGTERAQVKWLLAALAVAAVLFPLSWATDIGPDDGALVDLMSVAALGLVPLAILVAILRYRLYEIDRLISRTLSWAVITGVLGAFYGTLVVGLQSAFTDVTQGSSLAVAVSTLAAYALFQPLRRRVQATVDRRFDRGRYDGERMAAAFAERLRGRMDLDAVSGDLISTVSSATRPEQASIWLAGPGRR